MSRALRFVRRRHVDHFPKILRAVTTGSDNLDKIAERYAATAAMIAKRSMKKAPKRPRSRFGTLKAYSQRSKKYGRYYWQKGMYSRPGQPPFWVEKAGNTSGKRSKASLRQIIYERLGYARFRVGPIYLPQKAKPPVPALHEHGGTVRKQYNSYKDRLGRRIRRPQAHSARYPKRPYMAPAMQKAKRYVRGSKHFLDRLNNLAGMRATRRAS